MQGGGFDHPVVVRKQVSCRETKMIEELPHLAPPIGMREQESDKELTGRDNASPPLTAAHPLAHSSALSTDGDHPDTPETAVISAPITEWMYALP
jgi:hypothetical protein